MRRFTFLFCMVFILVAVFSFIAPHSLAATDYYCVCCNNSRIRAVASTTGNVLATVNKGNKLDSNDTSYIYSTNDWTYVTYNSVSGYIRNDLICPKGSSRRVIVSAGLNIRSTSDPASSVKFVLPYGEYLRSLSPVTQSYHYILVHSGTHRGSDGFSMFTSSYVASIP